MKSIELEIRKIQKNDLIRMQRRISYGETGGSFVSVKSKSINEDNADLVAIYMRLVSFYSLDEWKEYYKRNCIYDKTIGEIIDDLIWEG